MIKLKFKIGVIIATSLNRTDKLFTRSLPSVLNQSRIPDFILIVDDNSDSKIREQIKIKVENFSAENKVDFIYYTENSHTKGMSGTGAWNTAFDWYKSRISGKDYVAILDDDDSWNKDYIEKCEKEILNSTVLPDQVAAFLKRSDCEKPHKFSMEDLNVQNFLIGNPGIQGSNMFFSLNSVLKINGFDESLSTCTDRDLMIRFLSQSEKPVIKIVPEVLVNYFAGPETITCDVIKKEKGLDSFYKKYISFYSKDLILKTLERSVKFFSYSNAENIYKLWKLFNQKQDEEKIVIGMALHNNSSTVRKALESVLNQKNLKSKLYVLIADDSSTDNWKNQIEDLLQNENVLYWKIYNKNVSKTRNFINSSIKDYFGNVKLIGRLDSDDEYSSPAVLSQIEEIEDNTNADVIFAGNYLRLNGEILEKTNRADKSLSDHKNLISLLEKMAAGNAENELPSCNTFMTLKSLKKYPDIASAEDHFVTARLLWNKENYKLAFAENVLLTIYSLNGKLSDDNKKKKIYLDARKKLLEEVSNYE